MQNNQKIAGLSQASWLLGAILVFAILVTWPTHTTLANSWDPNPENVIGHGWLLVAFVGWVIFRRSQSIRLGPARIRWPIVAFLVILGLAWTVAANAAIFALQAVLVLLAVFLLVASVMGRQAFLALWWPLALLFLPLPIWGVAQGVLWQLTVEAVGALLGLLSIEFFMDGTTVRIASGSLDIASGCSGLGFFSVAVSVAFIIGYLNRASWRQHVVLVCCASAVAVISNWIRIVVIVWRADATNMQTSLVTEGHLLFGWVVFSVGLLIYCFLLGTYGLDEEPSLEPENVEKSSTVAGMSYTWPLAFAVAALGAFPIYSWYLDNSRQVQLQSRLEEAGGELVKSLAAAGEWVPAAIEPDHLGFLRREIDGKQVQVFEATYRRQRQGREMIGGGNSLLPSDGWQVDKEMVESNFAVALLRDPFGDLWVVRYTYSVGEWRSANAAIVQLRLGLAHVFDRPVSRFTAVGVRCGQDCAAAFRAVAVVWKDLFPDSVAVPLSQLGFLDFKLH